MDARSKDNKRILYMVSDAKKNVGVRLLLVVGYKINSFTIEKKPLSLGLSFLL